MRVSEDVSVFLWTWAASSLTFCPVVLPYHFGCLDKIISTMKISCFQSVSQVLWNRAKKFFNIAFSNIKVVFYMSTFLYIAHRNSIISQKITWSKLLAPLLPTIGYALFSLDIILGLNGIMGFKAGFFAGHSIMITLLFWR